MNFVVLPPRKDNHLFEVIYEKQNGYLTSVLIPPAPLFGFAPLCFESIELEVSWTGIVDHISGRTNSSYWIETGLHLPDSVPGGIRVDIEPPFEAGVGRSASLTVWKEFYDSRSGWLCIGDKDAKGDFRVAIVPSLIIVGTLSAIDAIWVKIARFE